MAALQSYNTMYWAMGKLLCALQVEDSETDAALVVRELQKAGYTVFARRVQDAVEMRSALTEPGWDVIIADHRLPAFDAPTALKVLHESGLDIPFIVVSANIGEDVAVDMMRSGAHDYLLKGNLTRMAAAVEREIREAHAREETRALEREYSAQQRRDEEALRQSYARLTSVLESITDGFFTLGRDWRFTYVNSQAERLLRRARQEVVGGHFWHAFPEKVFRSTLEHAIDSNAPVHFDAFSACFDAWFEVHGYPSADGLSVYFRDITERRRSEERIKQSLKEKEVLLREIHHRVKNNLQVISSMLRLQMHQVHDPSLLRILTECGDRIQTMALLHEQLHGAADLSTINLGDYMRGVAAKLFSSYGVNREEIRLETRLEEVHVSTDIATACGLIIQELVSNALQHAFQQGKGCVSLGLSTLTDGRIEVMVRDDGKGLPAAASAGPSTSLGLRLVHLLAEQIDASLKQSINSGTEYRLAFLAEPATATCNIVT